LDELDIEVTDFRLNPLLLKNNTDAAMLTETVYSHLLRSNCPVTNQPDWGSVSIAYTGQAIDHESILRYLISFREHNDFHEQCVERIFSDISRQCQPEKLTVQAYYTRRGGLDINPFRSNVDLATQFQRLVRQ
jgi:7-cyano-7-deazaguanine reductase